MVALKRLVRALANGVTMQVEAIGILAAMRGWPFVCNPGRSIVPQTPPAHVAELVEWARAA
jgi:uroporphyrinogen-III decarboxylase